jgi:hypothetical protein
LEALYSTEDDPEAENKKTLADDRAKAKYIVNTLLEAKKKYQATMKSQRSSSSFFLQSEKVSPSKAMMAMTRSAGGKLQYDHLNSAEKEFLVSSRRPKVSFRVLFSDFHHHYTLSSL